MIACGSSDDGGGAGDAGSAPKATEQADISDGNGDGNGDGLNIDIPDIGSGSGTATVAGVTYEFAVTTCGLSIEDGDASIFGEGTAPDGRPFIVDVSWTEDPSKLADAILGELGVDPEDSELPDLGLDEPALTFVLTTGTDSIFTPGDEVFSNQDKYTSLEVAPDGFDLSATFDSLYERENSVDITEPGSVQVSCQM